MHDHNDTPSCSSLWGLPARVRVVVARSSAAPGRLDLTCDEEALVSVLEETGLSRTPETLTTRMLQNGRAVEVRDDGEVTSHPFSLSSPPAPCLSLSDGRSVLVTTRKKSRLSTIPTSTAFDAVVVCRHSRVTGDECDIVVERYEGVPGRLLVALEFFCFRPSASRKTLDLIHTFCRVFGIGRA